MDEQIKKLGNEILAVMKEEVKNLWKKEDEKFLKDLAWDTAKQKILATTSDNPAEHEKNLRHIVATLEGEVVRKGLKLRWRMRDRFIQVLVAVIKTIAIPILKSYL